MKVKILLSVITLATSLHSCDMIEKTEEVVSTDMAIEAMSDYTLAAWHFQGVGNVSDEMLLYAENSQNKTLKSVGPEIIISPSDMFTFPKTITVNYGTNGFAGLDGRIRRGKLFIEIENGWSATLGSRSTTTFENYYQNDYKIEGTLICENIGVDEDGYPVFNIDVENGKINNKLGQTIRYSQESIRTWIAGNNTLLNIWDDTYLLKGYQSGICSNGVNYNITVRNNNPIKIELNCPYFKSGILDICIPNAPLMDIDYFVDTDQDGFADCSSDATLQIGEHKYPITNN